MSAHDDMAAVFAPVERAGRTQALTEALVAASARVTGHDEPDCYDDCTDRLRAVIACPTCYGEGVVVDTLGYGPEVREREVPCPECGEGPA